MTRISAVFRSELPLWTGVITTLLFIQNGEAWLADLSQGGWYLFVFA